VFRLGVELGDDVLPEQLDGLECVLAVVAAQAEHELVHADRLVGLDRELDAPGI